MADKEFLKEKAAKKQTALKAVWVLLVFVIIIVSMVVKITLTGSSSKTAFFSGLPTSEDAYSIAKEFIVPTLKSSSNKFYDDKFQFAKLSDSVYVIKSAVDTKDMSGDPVTTEFKIILRYNGGQVSKQSNWNVIDLQQY